MDGSSSISLLGAAAAGALVSAGVMYWLGRHDDSSSRAKASERHLPSADDATSVSSCDPIIPVITYRGRKDWKRQKQKQQAAAGQQDLSNLDKEQHSSAKYLLQLVKLCDKKLCDTTSAPLLRVLTRSRFQHAKEISENFGAMNAVRKAIDAVPSLDWGKLVSKGSKVNVYVPGDGRRPYTAAAVVLQTPSAWRVWSIDPLMMHGFCEGDGPNKGGESDLLGGLRGRITCMRCVTEEFDVPQDPCDLSIVVAVHSHCPLSELWQRVPLPRLCVSMPCCGQCGLLDGEPTLEYSDPDVLSAARRVLVHYDA